MNRYKLYAVFHGKEIATCEFWGTFEDMMAVSDFLGLAHFGALVIVDIIEIDVQQPQPVIRNSD